MSFEYQKYQILTNKEFRKAYPMVHFYLNSIYPVGLKVSDEHYKTFIGQKVVDSLIEDNIVNSKNLNSKWTNGFLKKVSEKTNHEVYGATFGLVPNFGGKMVLKESDDLRYSTELCFFVSLLYNFYSIQIEFIDKFTTYHRPFLPDTTGYGTKKIVVSPIENKYGNLFQQIDELIISEFEDAKFLPFRFDLIKLKDFEVSHHYSSDFCTQISKAFFCKGLSINEKTEIIGDIDYKMNKVKNQSSS